MVRPVPFGRMADEDREVWSAAERPRLTGSAVAQVVVTGKKDADRFLPTSNQPGFPRLP